MPLHLNLKDIEEQVRQVLRLVRRGDVVTVARSYSLDSEGRTREPIGVDIQYILARENGSKSWQSLKDRLNKDNLHTAPATMTIHVITSGHSQCDYLEVDSAIDFTLLAF